MNLPRTSRLHRDTFYFPYSCRRSHRAHTMRLLSGFALVFAGAFLLSANVQADEVEHDVITEAFDSLWTVAAVDDWEAGQFDANVDDFEELWQDLPADTYCELYASAGYLISVAGNTIAAEDVEDPFVPAIPAAFYLIDDLDRMAEDCLNEGV